MTFVPNNESQGPENLADILAKMFTARGWGRKTERVMLEAAWNDVIGEEFGPETRVNSLKRGVLEIEVRNPILMQELSQFHRKRIISQMSEKLPKQPVKEIRFRAGVW